MNCFLCGPCRIRGESLGLCIPPLLLSNGLVNMFPRQQRIVGGMIFYVVHAISNESRQLVLPSTSVYWELG
jgi:hypothetical protein